MSERCRFTVTAVDRFAVRNDQPLTVASARLLVAVAQDRLLADFQALSAVWTLDHSHVPLPGVKKYN
jgi:hypothetical protein